jgi:hypothetical protein
MVLRRLGGMPKWMGGLGQNHVYVSEGDHLAKSRVYVERVIIDGGLIIITRPFRGRLTFGSYWGELS